jgi:hypothetical protein
MNMNTKRFTIAAAAAWSIAAVAYVLLEALSDHRPTLTKVFTVAVVLAGSLGIVVLVKIDQHVGGLGAVGLTGIALVGIGVAVSAVTWGAVNVYLLIQGAGYLLFCVRLLREHSAPPVSTAVVGGAFFTAPIAFIIANAAEVGSLNEYGDRDAAFAVGFAVGATVMAIGLIGWTRWLDLSPEAGLRDDRTA